MSAGPIGGFQKNPDELFVIDGTDICNNRHAVCVYRGDRLQMIVFGEHLARRIVGTLNSLPEEQTTNG